MCLGCIALERRSLLIAAARAGLVRVMGSERSSLALVRTIVLNMCIPLLDIGMEALNRWSRGVALFVPSVLKRPSFDATDC